MLKTTRRKVLKGAAALAATAALPKGAHAQGEPIRIGILTPLTGAGGNDGPRMLKAMTAVFEEVNKQGGVLGRQVITDPLHDVHGTRDGEPRRAPHRDSLTDRGR